MVGLFRRDAAPSSSADTWLVAGLGNPGPQYAGNRHNVGAMVVDLLAERLGARFSRHRTTTMLAEARLRPGGPKLVLVRPLSYMNTSGGPVSSAAAYFGIPPERVIVVHDDLDLPFETIKLKADGGHGGDADHDDTGGLHRRSPAGRAGPLNRSFGPLPLTTMPGAG